MRLPYLEKLSTKTRVFLIAVIAFAAIGVALAVTDVMVNRYQTCLNCHEMNKAVSSWQASTHSRIPCVSCHHKEPGLYGLILGMPHKFTDLYGHVTNNYEKPIRIKEHIENKVCRRCHVNLAARTVSPPGDLVIAHDKHFDEQGVLCVQCHYAVVHGEQINGKTVRRPPMETCLKCHDGEPKIIASAPTLACKNCHTNKAMPANHKQADWIPTHGARSKAPKNQNEQCKRCHGWTKDFCNACHAGRRPSTHIGGTKWRTLHATRAKQNKAACLVCHKKEKFCYKCHDPF
jgi:cytochrome c-type protein NapC